MPRGRRSLSISSPQVSAPPAVSFRESDCGARRLTRSVSKQSAQPTIGDSITVKAAPEIQTPSAPRPGGRPRASPRKAATASFESVSSAPTLEDVSSEDELSTTANSKVPTPAATEGLTSSRASIMGFQVRIPSKRNCQPADPERALRKSVYSLDATSKSEGSLIADSEDECFSDTYLGARTARRLQQAVFAKAGMKTKPQALPAQRRGRHAALQTSPSPVLLSRPTSKRRPDTGLSTEQGPPAKRNKVVPDSYDSGLSETGYDINDGLSSDGQDSLSFADTDEPSGDDYDSRSDSEDEPLLASRRRGNATSSRNSTARNVSAPGIRGSRISRGPLPPPAVLTTVDDASTGESGNESGSLESDVASVSVVTSGLSSAATSDGESSPGLCQINRIAAQRRGFRRSGNNDRLKRERSRLEHHHPEISTMWDDLEKMPILKAGRAQQPQSISRRLKPFQLEGLAWMKEMEKTDWKGGLLGDEMGLGKTIQAVSLVMSDYPAKQPSLVLVPPVALMQWQSEIKDYTDGTLKTLVFHGTNQKTKGITVKELKQYDVIMMSYNSLESMYRKQERGFKRKDGIHKEKSVIHSIKFHRIILDEAHCIKTRTTMTAKACFALKTDYRWCLTGTPLQNRIGEFFSLIRFLNIEPFASYLCKQCPCSSLEWMMNDDNRCRSCKHAGMQHVSVFNQELLNPIQKFGNLGPGHQAFLKLRLMTERIMLRRLKRDHTDSMELPVKEIYVDRQLFGEEENDFANSIMTNGQRKFDTYVAQGVLLNNYANIFGLIMQMRQVADHPDLLLKKHAEGGQNVLVCCICDESAEDTVRSRCKHEFCRACVTSYVRSTDEPDCPRCHIPLSIDLEQPEIEQDKSLVKKNSIINRIKMENWTSSSKIELLVHELHKLRSDNASHKSIIFSQFTTMLQLIEWRLRRAGITTVMLDGSMTPAQRQASIEHFMNKVDVECFLVSLKAGGVALNLTEASRVFIVDPWWNPAAEWQSADRCHRIGQTRPCTITRLCIEDSVESRMVLIQEKKTSMIHSTVNGDDEAMESLSPEDMQFLFRGS